MKSLDDLFIHFLADVYYAERRLVLALPKMAESARSPELKQAFNAHHDETVRHVERLTQVFETLGIPANTVVCEAIRGLIEEAEEVINGADAGPVRDAGLVACGQAVEYYEMARYHSLIAWAQAIDHREVEYLLRQNYEEERKADKLLSDLAANGINRAAARADKPV